MLDAVIIMDCRGLVDPRNKPFGRVLPLEVQVKIMFWVECFYTMDKRKKVVRELRGLPICRMTGWPKNLGPICTQGFGPPCHSANGQPSQFSHHLLALVHGVEAMHPKHDLDLHF